MQQVAYQSQSRVVGAAVTSSGCSFNRASSRFVQRRVNTFSLALSAGQLTNQRLVSRASSDSCTALLGAPLSLRVPECQRWALKSSTLPAWAVTRISLGCLASGCASDLGMADRSRWLPGTTRVAPFEGVKSSSIQIAVIAKARPSGAGDGQSAWRPCCP